MKTRAEWNIDDIPGDGAGTASEPFHWEITRGEDVWTDDPGEIDKMHDPPIIWGLLREREVATVVGPAKAHKTWFAMAMGLAVAGGTEFLGEKTTSKKVLYIDYELKPRIMRRRICALADTRPEGFHYANLRGSGRSPTIDDIEKIIMSGGYGLVIVDSLYLTGWLEEENSNELVTGALSPLQGVVTRNPCTIVVIDHTAKGGGSDRSAVDAARGASSKGGFVDAVLVLRPTNKGPDPEGTYAILDPVLRDWPAWKALPLVSFSWHRLHATVLAVDAVDRKPAEPREAKVLDFLATVEGGAGFSQIEVATGLTGSTLRRTLEKLVKDGLVAKGTDPRHRQRLTYRLPDLADGATPSTGGETTPPP